MNSFRKTLSDFVQRSDFLAQILRFACFPPTRKLLRVYGVEINFKGDYVFNPLRSANKTLSLWHV